MLYKCNKCEKHFDQKCHLVNHLRRKNPCKNIHIELIDQKDNQSFLNESNIAKMAIFGNQKNKKNDIWQYFGNEQHTTCKKMAINDELVTNSIKYNINETIELQKCTIYKCLIC